MLLTVHSPSKLEPSDGTLHEPLISNASLPKIAGLFHKAKRCIVVTGAGISCSGGIPDFRSSDGLYNLVKSRYPKSVVRGRDLFDATLFKDVTSTQIFYSFMGELKHIVEDAKCTRTHQFIGRLYEQGKLLRCYTQNIDSLEAAAGIPGTFGVIPVADPATSKNEVKLDAEEKPPVDNEQPSTVPTSPESEISAASQEQQPQCQTAQKLGITKALHQKTKALTMSQKSKLWPVVQLHGSLNHVRCTLCATSFSFTVAYREKFKGGSPPPCPSCKVEAKSRENAGKRRVTSGTLRPDIILYNEAHPKGDLIGAIQAIDVRRKPDLLLVMGTSLKVVGLKRLVKDMAKNIHLNGGSCIFVNRTEAPGKEWDTIFDYQVLANADDWVDDIDRSLAKLAQNKQRTLVKSETSMMTLSAACTAPQGAGIIAMTSLKGTKNVRKDKENTPISGRREIPISTIFKKTKATTGAVSSRISKKDAMSNKKDVRLSSISKPCSAISTETNVQQELS